jgi:hypothetical protein
MARHAIRVAVLATATLAGSVSPSRPENSAPPAEVQAHVNDARKECAGIEGGELRVDPQAYQKLDLTGDGRDDYLLDYSFIKCSTAEGYFSGTGGSPLVIFVAKRDDSYVKVFEGPVRSYTIAKGRGPRTITFDLHGGFCGKHGAEACPKKHRITAKPFAYKDR